MSETPAYFAAETSTFQFAWQGRSLLGIEGDRSDAPVIFSIGRDGQADRTELALANARYISVIGLAGAENGAVAAIGTALSEDGRAVSFLALISPDRQRRVVVRLQLYLPKAVAAAPNGVTWTAGWVWDGETVSQDNLIERFDSSGKLLGLIPVSTHGRWSSRDEDAAENSVLRSSRDRVGWLTNANQYIEFDLNGHELGRYPPPPGPPPQAFESSMALSASNDVLVGTKDGHKMKLWLLDRQSRSWAPVS
ncbi:MAG TPA: hypothetical protein VMT86_18735, partial [Bryobacteraceae bacterium]|nr:hypothetical protein [Bryobacteraceae bacterium]